MLAREAKCRRCDQHQRRRRDERNYIVVLFDVRIPGVAERLHSERAAYRERGEIEALDDNHYILLIRPGGAHGE